MAINKRIYEPAVDEYLFLSHEDLMNRYEDANQCIYLNGNYQILWFTKPLTIFVESQRYDTKENTVCLISKNVTVNFLEERREELEETALFFSDCLLSRFDKDWSAYIKQQVFDANSGIKCYTVPPQRTAILEHLVKDINKEQRERDRWSSQRIVSLVNLFILELCRYGEIFDIQQHHVNSYSESLFHRFVDSVDVNYKSLHKMYEYAGLLGVTVDVLTKETKKHSGLTPRDIIINKIIKESKHQLLYTQKSVKEIAYTLGFDDASNFIKVFKTITEITPSEFRQLQQL